MHERRLNLGVYLLRTESSKSHSNDKIDFIFLHGNILHISELYFEYHSCITLYSYDTVYSLHL